jgi:hypothetical protein
MALLLFCSQLNAKGDMNMGKINSISEKYSLHQAAPSCPESFTIEPDKYRERHVHGNWGCSEERVAHAKAQGLEDLSSKTGERQSAW